MRTKLHLYGVIVCVLVALEEVVGGIGAPIRIGAPNYIPSLLPNIMSGTASSAGPGVTGTLLVNVLLYSNPALKGSLCLPAHFLPAWIIKVP